MRVGVSILVLLTALAGCTDPSTAPPQAGGPPQVALEQVFEGGGALVGLVPVPDAQAMLAVSQAGRVLVWPMEGRLREEPFLEISDRVRHNGEEGLLGLALPPDFHDTGAVFVHYSDRSENSILARFLADPQTLVTDPASGEELLRVKQPYPNHNGGQLAFGPDGMLYMALGDGGLAGDPGDNAQDPSTLLGSILRINPGREAGTTYSVPRDNPFVGREGADEVYILGVRNPWRFSFDTNGDLWIGDVGQDATEEVDHLPKGQQAGANLGWPWYEGSERFRTVGTAPADTVKPVAEYPRSEGRCAVTGGFVYRGTSVPELSGQYVLADYCKGTVWSLDAATASTDGTLEEALETELKVSSFAEDHAGELYVLHHGGSAWKVVSA